MKPLGRRKSVERVAQQIEEKRTRERKRWGCVLPLSRGGGGVASDDGGIDDGVHGVGRPYDHGGFKRLWMD